MSEKETYETSEEEVAEENNEEENIENAENASQEEEESQVQELEERIQELEDQTIRLQAELQNIQRRNKKNREELIRYRSQSLAEELLPVADNLERAMEIEVDTEQGENLKKGIELVFQQLKTAFEKEEIEVVDPLGEPFDPELHESYTVMPSEEYESGTVAQVFEKGYVYKGRILRAAKVAVAE